MSEDDSSRWYQLHVVLSLRVENHDHINIEEGRAFLRYLRWVLRKPSRFGRRVVVLVDSRVWLGASPTFKTLKNNQTHSKSVKCAKKCENMAK